MARGEIVRRGYGRHSKIPDKLHRHLVRWKAEQGGEVRDSDIERELKMAVPKLKLMMPTRSAIRFEVARLQGRSTKGKGNPTPPWMNDQRKDYRKRLYGGGE